MNDKAAALYGLFYALGAISAPLLGSMVYNMLSDNWWYTCDVFAIISSIYVVIFFVFNIMPDIHKERQQRQEMAERLLQSEHFNRVININIIEEENESQFNESKVNAENMKKNTHRATALFGHQSSKLHEVEKLDVDDDTQTFGEIPKVGTYDNTTNKNLLSTNFHHN